MSALVNAIRRAVELSPCSARALALEAGIDPSLLTRILAGTKGISPETAAKLEAALLTWRDGCAQGAELIHKANTEAKRGAR